MTYRLGIFCSGNGTHLQTIDDIITQGFDAEVVLFITNNCKTPAYNKAINLFYNKKDKNKFHAYFVDPKLYENRVEYDKYIANLANTYNLDLILFLGYMRIVNKEFLDIINTDIINIHPSLLPSFKGNKAIQQALEAGIKITGCTSHYVSEEVDSGEIIHQIPIEIINDDYESLKTKIVKQERYLLFQTLLTYFSLDHEQYLYMYL